MNFATFRHDLLCCPHCGCRNSPRVDLVEGNDCHSLPELSSLKESLSGLLVIHNDIEELTPCSDLQSCCVGLKVLLDFEVLGNQSLDRTAVKAFVRVLVLEVDATNSCLLLC